MVLSVLSYFAYYKFPFYSSCVLLNVKHMNKALGWPRGGGVLALHLYAAILLLLADFVYLSALFTLC